MMKPIAKVNDRRGAEAKHRSATRSMFERIATSYDTLNRLLSVGIDQRWRARAVALAAKAPAGPILDLCAGTMDMTALLMRARPADRVVAVDFSPAMLELGRRKAPSAEVVVADVARLPFESGTFSAVVCAFGVRNLADPIVDLREVPRVLRPGGLFITLELFKPTLRITRAFHRTYAGLVLPVIGGLISGDRDAYRYLARSVGGFLRRDQYECGLLQLGFKRVSGFDLSWGIASIVCASFETRFRFNPTPINK